MARVGVIGASGFVGAAVTSSLATLGVEPVALSAPRLGTSARTLSALQHELTSSGSVVAALEAQIETLDAVVNAAGIAGPAAMDSPELFGANSLLPSCIQNAVRGSTREIRFVHVSSAAVQGTMTTLTESPTFCPFSPYSASKALGEQALHRSAGTIIYRATSVHGIGRSVTRSLVRLASSPLSSVAGEGAAPTPQALIENVGHAIAHLAICRDEPPHHVLHPWEGLTTGTLMSALGGKDPKHLPTGIARGVVSTVARVGRNSSRVAAQARRLELLWFGQPQSSSWLERSGWQPLVGPAAWDALGQELRAN